MRRPRPSHSHPLIEPLEPRIAPAGIIFIATSFASEYKNPTTGAIELQFINAAHPGTNPDNIAIAKTVGENASVYFIEVTAGEDVKIPTTVGYDNLINVTAGTVVAFFTGALTDITGVSLSTKVSVAIGAGINGDVVTNFNTKTGRLGGSAEVAGHATQLLDNTVVSLAVAGPITGAFVAGGAVAQFEATGSVHEILTGTAANGYKFSFEGVTNTTGDTTLSVPVPAAGTPGPSLSNVIIGGTSLIELGAGGMGSPGGGISGLTLLNDTAAFTIIGGTGGNSGNGGNPAGAGGSITNVLVEGPLADEPNPANSLITIEGGTGGKGLGSSVGGAGGSVTGLFVDYISANINDPAVTFLADNVTVEGGTGGNGIGGGGAGGSLNNVNVLTETPHGAGDTFEYQLLGGVGGNAVGAGRGGAGGSINNSTVTDHLLPTIDTVTGLPDDLFGTSPTNTHALIEGGAGGSSPQRRGGVGGSIDGLTVKGYNFEVAGGPGGAGHTSGGAGGGVTTLDVLGSTGNLPGDNFHAETVIVTGGAGGAGATVDGGAGGSLAGLTISDADFGSTGLVVAAGAGGTGITMGGAGGALSNMTVTSVDFLTDSHPLGNTGNVSIVTGGGGSAAAVGGTGGAGGAMTNVTVVATRLVSSTVTTGAGGLGGGKNVAGFGGAGGVMTNVAVRDSEDLLPSNTTASTGILLDTTASFVTLDGVAVGDAVENTTTGAATVVTAVVSNTELDVASDIFATGDAYLVNGADSGTAQASQDTIIDNTSNFIADGVKVGDVVEDLTTVANNAANDTILPVIATVTSIVSAHELDVSADISHVGDQYTIINLLPTLGEATLTAGAGGAGGHTGHGGAGGAIVGSSANAPGTVTFTAGAGGAAGTGAAAGAGGNLNGDGALSTYGSGLLTAGSAGATGFRAGAGGSVIGANVQALLDVSLIAGSGTGGGAGGSVTQSGFTGAPSAGSGLNLAPPTGNITVQAGAGGSSTGHAGGAGGSITTLTGFISAGDGALPIITQFDAGAGGSGTTAGGAGGSVSNVRIFGGGGEDVTFFIDAGDAGNASTGGIGATGGSVTNVGGGANSSASGIADFSISPLTDFHHISAGNGGSAVRTGGLGGSVSTVYVNSAIGVRTGAAFGFNLAGAGGISAGAGGAGKTRGQAGNVTNISADAIASIVAGHILTGQALEATNLANKVDGIILNGSVVPALVQTLQFTFDGENTVTVPTNASPLEIAADLNDLPAITAAGGVTVVANGTSGYVITFTKTGVQMPLTAQEPSVESDGSTTVVVQGYGEETFGAQEVQTIQPTLGPFALTFEGESTVLLPKNATATEVMAALNALPAVQAELGNGVTVGVTVAASDLTSAPSYTVTFGAAGTQGLIEPVSYPLSTELVHGSATAHEVQNVQTFGLNQFRLSFDGDTTAALPAAATAAEVAAALNALPTISAVGGVTAAYHAPGTVETNPSYTITFIDTGAKPIIYPDFDAVIKTTAGTTTTSQVDTLTFPAGDQISPTQFATANFVGSIDNINRPDATTFSYTKLVAGSSFEFGDAPIDGLIAAANLTANKNFVPEAFVTSIDGTALLVDNLNS